MNTPRKHPETLRLTAISPALTVDDLQESLHWYGEVVGFHVGQTWDQDGTLVGAELVAGDHRILLMQDDGARGMDRSKGEGLRLHLQTRQDIDEIADGIQRRGGTLTSDPADQPWGARSFDLTDPDGFRLTVSSPYG